MQQQTQMMPMMQSSFPPTNITTEQIQKYLDENKKLIMAILDNQNLGKLAECAQYQALLQKNLMYLAAIADAQPPTSTVPSQMAAHPAMQQGAYFMQHPQAGAAMAQQSSMFSQKVPLQFNTPHHQMQDPQQHHVFQGQMGMRPGGANNAETTHGGGGGSGFGPLSNAIGRGGNKQDNSEAVVNGGDGQGKSASGHGGSDTS